MEAIVCVSALENCENLYDSFGEICVRCNCCGRFDKETMWDARAELHKRQLNDHIVNLNDGSFDTKLQKMNICKSIRYHADKLLECYEHIFEGGIK